MKGTITSVLVFFVAISTSQAAIINGDFETGNTGFTSQYSFAPIKNTTEGEYVVRSDPQNWNGKFAATPDHTSGSGNMLVVNGATSDDLFLWQQMVPVSPSSVYTFSTWISTAAAGESADLIVDVNGTVLGPSFTAPSETGTWENWTETWNSGTSTTADIRIFNTNLSWFPNDFYVDDISFTAIPAPTLIGMALLGVILLATTRQATRRSIAT